MFAFRELGKEIKEAVLSVHPLGYPLFFILLVPCVVLLGLGGVMHTLSFVFTATGFVMLVMALWVAYFFRDPKRIVPKMEGVMVAPADGKIMSIEKNVFPPEEITTAPHAPYTRIIIFMNIFNCHVNRTPVAGVIKVIVYRPGTFLSAMGKQAALNNERQTFVIETQKGEHVILSQIAGLVARRIVGFVGEGDTLACGQRIGMIRFGSCVSVYIPSGYVLGVCEGQTTLAGETIMASFFAGKTLGKTQH